MKLSQVSRFLASETIDGYDPVNKVWVPGVAQGRFRVFDQFISSRNFGQLKRILTIPGDGIPAGYPIIRVSGADQRYMLEWGNKDLDGSDKIQTIYQLRECPFDAQLLRLGADVNSNGVPVSQAADEDLGTFMCALELYSYRDSPEFDQVVHSQYTLHFTDDVPVDTQVIAKVNGVEYTINSAGNSLWLKEIRAIQRGFE